MGFKQFLLENIDDEYLQAIQTKDRKIIWSVIKKAAKNAKYDIIAHHGTTTDEKFTVFDLEKGGSSSDAKDAKHAFYFSSSSMVADFYTGRTTGYVIDVFLRLENPQKIDYKKLSWDQDKQNRQISFAKNNGKDSVIFLNIGEGNGEYATSYAVFSPEQIKLSDFITYDDDKQMIPLSKRFDKTNPDIRY